MTVRAFKIQWREDLGPMWMNRDNLLQCLRTSTHTGDGTVLEVYDITEELQDLQKVVAFLDSMIKSGEKHSEQSREAVAKVLGKKEASDA